MAYQYSYLIGDLILFTVWIVLFLLRKDVRKEMLFMSTIFGFAGLIVEFVYIKDWWQPLTITNTAIGIEDFLFGFFIGGIAAVIYEEIFKKKIKLRKISEEKIAIRIISFLITGAILFLASFFIFELHSFWASLIAILGTTLIIWIKRKDLIVDSLISGFLVALVAVLGFPLLEIITPGYVLNHWDFNKLMIDTVIFGIPLVDVIWFFSAGLLIGPLYEFWQEGRLKKLQ